MGACNVVPQLMNEALAYFLLKTHQVQSERVLKSLGEDAPRPLYTLLCAYAHTHTACPPLNVTCYKYNMSPLANIPKCNPGALVIDPQHCYIYIYM